MATVPSGPQAERKFGKVVEELTENAVRAVKIGGGKHQSAPRRTDLRTKDIPDPIRVASDKGQTLAGTQCEDARSQTRKCDNRTDCFVRRCLHGTFQKGCCRHRHWRHNSENIGRTTTVN